MSLRLRLFLTSALLGHDPRPHVTPPQERGPDFSCVPKIAPGKGRIWVYRTAPKGPGLPPFLEVDRYPTILPGIAYTSDVSPGKHTVSLGAFTDTVEFEVAAGDDVFVRYSVPPGLFSLGFSAALVDRQTAQAELHQHTGVDFSSVKKN